MGNKDENTYCIYPDHKIPLSPHGIEQAKQSGILIRKLLDGNNPNWKVYVYVSPYERTRSTLREMGRAFPETKVIGVREECRVREQDFGNFQDAQKMKHLKETRNKFGRFFYRFPEGESGADVYDRVSSFLESFEGYRDEEVWRGPGEGGRGESCDCIARAGDPDISDEVVQVDGGAVRAVEESEKL
ncbi:phosphoglycerate mutase-like protein at74h [Phtheirospermum japonicum]|uniref:Phosphoglycerate mutase-like protein at74h n=1 Tax=Phtheirospermum japonicum TaxID=374723 RepID=A0A830D0T2_9LAMI|nr:phosphoglycerate mutase-like protein at74h [Phtheirospermum japonicum]